MVDNSIVAAYLNAFALVGEPVTFFRPTGVAPNIVLSPSGGATVTAVVRKYTPDATQTGQGGYGASQVGAVTLGDRIIFAMATDLSAAGYPLPMQKGDQATLISTGETLIVTKVDASNRNIAGCIELAAAGSA